MKSPLTDSSNIQLLRQISTAFIIELYHKHCSIDVSKFFEGIEFVDEYKCLDTGYRFYSPFSTAGNAGFYEQLQKFDWYYEPWKWEHQSALKHLGKKVLEVGCGEGSFLKKVKDQHTEEVLGLELNPAAVKKATEKGIKVFNQSIEEFAENNANQFDCVCSFQVVEHVPAVKDFLQAQVKCLKKGGRLIISVPNNDSFLKWDPQPYLNLPPHHSGLWNEESLKNLTGIFNVKLLGIEYEPLADNRIDYFMYATATGLRKKYLIPARVSTRIIPIFISFLSKKFKGLTIQAVYEKI